MRDGSSDVCSSDLQRRLTADIEESLLLAGKARVRQVLRRRAGAYCHVGIGGTGPVRELPVGFPDRLGGLFGPVTAPDGPPDGLAGPLTGYLELGRASGRERVCQDV